MSTDPQHELLIFLFSSFDNSSSRPILNRLLSAPAFLTFSPSRRLFYAGFSQNRKQCNNTKNSLISPTTACVLTGAWLVL